MKITNFLERWHLHILVFIIVLAAVLRLWHLETLLQGFHTDEVLNGYVGRYILENGVDLYGNKWPILYFNHFGDYPNVIPMYLSGLFTFFFGVNTFAVRLPIALVGTGTVALVYGIARWLWKPRWLALVPAFLLAVTPWHIVLSRATAEGITVSAVFLIGLFLLFNSFESKKKWQTVAGFLVLLFTYLLYPGFRVVTPLALLPIALVAPEKKWKIVVTCVAIVFLVLTLGISQTVWGRGRYEQTSLWTHNNTLGLTSLQYSMSLGPNRILEARLFHNVPVLGAREFIRQYASYFSPEFLFSHGGLPMRYFVPDHGLLYWSMAILFLLFIFFIIQNPVKTEEWQELFDAGRKKYTLYLLWILAVTPVPAALTVDDVPNVHRTVLLSVLYCLFAALCVYVISLQKILSKWLLGLFMIGVLAETIYFWHYYAQLSSIYTTLYRKDEQQVVADWLIQHRSEYEKIYIRGNELIALHYLFNDARFPKELAGKFKVGIELEDIDNIVFVDEDCVIGNKKIDSNSTNSAYVIRHGCVVPDGYVVKAELKRFDGSAAYEVLTK